MTAQNGENDNTLSPINPDLPKQWTQVIVHLKVPDLDRMQANSAKLKDPAKAKAMDQKIAGRIAMVANRVLKQVKPAGAKVIRRYGSLPLLALQVTPRATTILNSLPEVLSIEPDQLTPPAR